MENELRRARKVAPNGFVYPTIPNGSGITSLGPVPVHRMRYKVAPGLVHHYIYMTPGRHPNFEEQQTTFFVVTPNYECQVQVTPE